MGVPEHGMGGGDAVFGGTGEERREGIADEAYLFIVGCVIGNAGSLHEKAGKKDDEDPGQGQVILRFRIEAFGFEEVSADRCHDDADDGGESCQIEHKGEDEVEVPVEVGDTGERTQEVIFQGNQCGADSKDEKAPEDKEMHHAGVAFAGF